MSRIHEALKKAAQERDAQTATRSVSDLVDLSTAEVATETPRRVEVKQAAAFVPTQKIDPNACKFADFAKRSSLGIGKWSKTPAFSPAKRSINQVPRNSELC